MQHDSGIRRMGQFRVSGRAHRWWRPWHQ
jgi:hypothetical protein